MNRVSGKVSPNANRKAMNLRNRRFGQQVAVCVIAIHLFLMLKYIFCWMICLTGLIFFSICVMVSTNLSLDTPVFLFLNLVSSSVVVIGLRIK